jgi:hypothetical protein
MPGAIITNNGSGKNYPGKLTFRVFITCLTAAFGGLIFGYDLGISGIIHIRQFSLYFILFYFILI